MPESRRFRNSWSRLERAAYHLTAFQDEWNALSSQNLFGSAVRLDKDSGWFVASLTASDAAKAKIKATTLPLILGEFAYQLRAALDGLIWEAVTITQGTEPSSEANRLEFPVLNGKERDFRKCVLHRFPLPDKLKSWIESVQPDSAEKPLGHPDRGLAGALEDVHDLARLDRHRRLRIVASFPTELYANFVFDPSDGFKAVGQEGLPCNILGDDYELLRFKVESVSKKQPESIRIETGAKFEIFFEDLVTYQDIPSGERLGNLCAAVQHVVNRFEEEFNKIADIEPVNG